MASGNVIPLRPDQDHAAEPGLAQRRARPATYVVKVSLLESEPEIWRRLELDSGLDLRAVHRILQAAMGWTDSHLHEFDTSRTPERLLADSEVEEGEVGIPERDVHLDQVLVDTDDVLGYLYDFGDAWDHELRLEEVIDAGPTEPVRVVDGASAGPAEDIGGVGAWNTYVRWYEGGRVDPDDREWLLDLFEQARLDPRRFDVSECQAAISVAGLARDELLARLPPHPDVAALAVDLPDEGVRLLAGLSAAMSRPGLDRREAVRPMLALLRLARDGIDLTPAGQMKQAAVRVLLDDLGWGGDWVFGKTLQERSLPPVRWVRQAAHTLGLVRRHGGRLVLTPKGRELADDADGVWRHLVAGLPQGKAPEERMAGVIHLLTVRAGRSTYGMFERDAGVLFDLRAWQSGEDAPDDLQLRDWQRPTYQLLLALKQDHRTMDDLPEQEAAAMDALWGVED